MAKTNFVLVLTCVLFLGFFTEAKASIVSPGDTIRFIDGFGNSGGGEFGVAKLPNVNTELFQTFCLERNEFIDFNVNGFKVDNIQDYAQSGGQGGSSGGKDFLDDRTKWLYFNFRLGVLQGYDFLNTGTGRAGSADQLQHAIWRLEGETYNAALSNFYFNLATTELTSYNNNALTYSGNMGEAIGRVAVMNISWATSRGQYSQGQRGQSMLTLIPEPGSMMVWGVLSLLASGMAFGRRRSS